MGRERMEEREWTGEWRKDDERSGGEGAIYCENWWALEKKRNG
jgi:hypothetical protein